MADVTHGNNGAYWEAGYAEGLGKPVIYTCERSKFDKVEGRGGAHFDTNHHLTVLWDSDAMADAADRLKATIRATFPEAKRER
jgi:nucleoside 2-deoxyribosyltransferase